MPEMIVPKSSHDRFCLEKSSQKARSTITNPESAGCLVAFAGWDGLPEVSDFKREGRSGVKGTIEAD